MKESYNFGVDSEAKLSTKTSNNSKVFVKGDYTNCLKDICEIWYDDKLYCIVALDDADKIVDVLNDNRELEQFRNIARDYNIPFDKLTDAFEEGLNSDTITTLETEIGKLKQSHEKVISLINKAIVEMLDGKKYDAEKLLTTARNELELE